MTPHYLPPESLPDRYGLWIEVTFVSVYTFIIIPLSIWILFP